MAVSLLCCCLHLLSVWIEAHTHYCGRSGFSFQFIRVKHETAVLCFVSALRDLRLERNKFQSHDTRLTIDCMFEYNIFCWVKTTSIHRRRAIESFFFFLVIIASRIHNRHTATKHEFNDGLFRFQKNGPEREHRHSLSSDFFFHLFSALFSRSVTENCCAFFLLLLFVLLWRFS